MISKAINFNFSFFRSSLIFVFCMLSSFAQFGYSWDWALKRYCSKSLTNYFVDCKKKPEDASGRRQPRFGCRGYVKGDCSEKKCIDAIGRNCIEAKDIAIDVIEDGIGVCNQTDKYLKAHSDKLQNKSTECSTKKYSVIYLEPDKTSQAVSTTHDPSFVSGLSSIQLSPSSTFSSPIGSTSSTFSYPTSSSYQGALNGNSTVHFRGVSCTKTPSLESSSVNLQSEIVVSPTQKGQSSIYSMAALGLTATAAKLYAFLSTTVAQLPGAPTNGTYPYSTQVISPGMYNGTTAVGDDDDDGLLPVKIIIPVLGVGIIGCVAVADRYCFKNKLLNIFKNKARCCFGSEPDEHQSYDLDALRDRAPLVKYDANNVPQSDAGPFKDLEAQED